MKAAELYSSVRASRKYANVCDETLLRLCEEEARKQRSDRDAVKAVKTELHAITGAFIGQRELCEAGRLLSEWEAASDDLGERDEILRKILSLHKSSAERLRFLREMYADISRVAGEGPVFDIACGFGPFAAPFLEGASNYFATDIDTGAVSLANRFLKLSGIPGGAFAGDVLYKIPGTPANNVLLLKLLPLLERRRQGYAARLVSNLPSRFFTISFPTRSLSGRNVGMYGFYGGFMRASFPEGEYEYMFEREYANELLFIIRRR